MDLHPVPLVDRRRDPLAPGVPKSTGYRYVQALAKVGLLVQLDRSIAPGPRIIELDRCARECDPVLNAAIEPMHTLAEKTGLEAFISKR